MAIQIYGILNGLPSELIPTGFISPPVAVTFSDYTYTRQVVFSLNKDSVATTNSPTVTLERIWLESGNGIVFQLQTLVNSNFSPSLNWVCYGILNKIRFSNDPEQSGFKYLKSGVVQYDCTVTFFIKQN